MATTVPRPVAFVLVFVTVCCACALPVSAAPARDKVDDAVQRAIAYLVSRQQSNGSVHDGARHNITAMTALSIMSMAAVGHQPTDPTREGNAMRKALEYVLREDRIDRNGYFGRNDGSRMYGHGIITLMLGEMLGMGVDDEMDKRIADRLRGAVDLILRDQKPASAGVVAGGWRYDPGQSSADLSISVWQVMALRSAKNAGMKVPKEAIDRAVAYVVRCFKDFGPQQRRGDVTIRKGAFGYMPGANPDYAMAAAGLLSMQVCGRYDAPEVAGAADWLFNYNPRYNHNWFFYGTYYYAQGMYQYKADPKYARESRRRVESLLLTNQNQDGSWTAHRGSERSAGRIYTTSMAVLSLSVKYHYLPIYQR